MKTAREMFNKLGYERTLGKGCIRYYNSKEDTYIWFNTRYKKVEILFEFDIELLEAINKQVEELRW